MKEIFDIIKRGIKWNYFWLFFGPLFCLTIYQMNLTAFLLTFVVIGIVFVQAWFEHRPRNRNSDD